MGYELKWLAQNNSSASTRGEGEPMFSSFPVAVSISSLFAQQRDKDPGTGKSRDLKVACSSYDLSAVHSTYGQKGSLNNSVSLLFIPAQFNLVVLQ